MLGLIPEAPQENEQIDTLFKDDWHEPIHQSIQTWLHEKNSRLLSLSRGERRDLVMALENKGPSRGGDRPIMWRATWGWAAPLFTNL